MHGVIHLLIQSAHLKYEMTFYRNITILKGDSATGKTTLVDMIQEYNLNGADTGINLSCDVPCRVLAGNTWMEQLNGIHKSLVFIDEGNRFVAQQEFARAIQGTDNYYVIVTRESISNLPYSVTEIYGIRSAGKYSVQEPVYHHMYRIYGDYNSVDLNETVNLLVEDSNSGYEFFSKASSKDVECISAQGAGNIFGVLQAKSSKANTVIIADGAAFGAYMEKVYQVMLRNKGIQLYLPESFEWLILSSGVLRDKEIEDILENPSDYIDCETYISWERYFTHLLTSRTADTYMRYSKSKLNPAFLQGKIREQILRILPETLRNVLRVK